MGRWSQDGKFAKTEGIARCWRKSGILPDSMNDHLVRQFGSTQSKKEQEAAVDELCALMKAVRTKAKDVDCQSKAIALT